VEAFSNAARLVLRSRLYHLSHRGGYGGSGLLINHRQIHDLAVSVFARIMFRNVDGSMYQHMSYLRLKEYVSPRLLVAHKGTTGTFGEAWKELACDNAEHKLEPMWGDFEPCPAKTELGRLQLLCTRSFQF